MKIKTRVVAILSTVAFLGLGVYTMNATEISKDDNQVSLGAVNDEISGHWAEEAMRYFEKIGLFSIYENGYLVCDSEMTRVSFLSMLVNVVRLDGEAEPSFFDIVESDTFYDYIKVALANNVIDDGERFRPYEHITVGEAVEMLNRALSKEKGVEVPFIKESINKNNNYTSEDYITRASVANVMYDIIQKSNNSRSGDSWMPMELKYMIEKGYIDRKWSDSLINDGELSRKDFVELISDAFDIALDTNEINDTLITKEEVSAVICKLLGDKLSLINDKSKETCFVYDKEEISSELYNDVMTVLNSGVLELDSAFNFRPLSNISPLEAIKLVYKIKLSDEGTVQEEVEQDLTSQVEEVEQDGTGQVEEVVNNESYEGLVPEVADDRIAPEAEI